MIEGEQLPELGLKLRRRRPVFLQIVLLQQRPNEKQGRLVDLAAYGPPPVFVFDRLQNRDTRA